MGGFENGMAYSASKGAMIAMTYGIARQLAPKKITVNCVAPGTIESDMLKARDVETIKRLLGRFPIGRFGTSDEVAAAVCYFASEEAGFTTGAVLDVNGGLFMG
jgi:3-oxoacyl-[acyl-carrier protein] reductase